MSEITNMPIYDLRKYKTVEALNEIDSIINVALLIKPKNPLPEIESAIAQIDLSAIGGIVELEDDVRLSIFNGAALLSDKDFKEDGKTFVVVNGVCILQESASKSKGGLFCNGTLILSECDYDIDIVCVNGQRKTAKVEHALFYQNSIRVTKDLLNYLKPYTVIVAANKIIIDSEIEVQDLERSTAMFIASNKIICMNKVYSYMVVEGVVGNKISIDEEACSAKN